MVKRRCKAKKTEVVRSRLTSRFHKTTASRRSRLLRCKRSRLNCCSRKSSRKWDSKWLSNSSNSNSSSSKCRCKWCRCSLDSLICILLTCFCSNSTSKRSSTRICRSRTRCSLSRQPRWQRMDSNNKWMDKLIAKRFKCSVSNRIKSNGELFWKELSFV